MPTIYTHPQETWTVEQCQRRAKRIGSDGYGSPHPFPGRVAGCASPRPEYGQRVRYNGGWWRNGEHYEYEEVPFPQLPPGFVIINRPMWGFYLVHADSEAAKQYQVVHPLKD